MDFIEKQAIYIQIGEYISEQILLRKYKVNDKIPSIRELAVALEVNPNTVQRTYDLLQQRGIISTKRGMGYFVEENANQIILDAKRQDFIENDLPLVFKNMQLLDIGTDEFLEKYTEYLNKN